MTILGHMLATIPTYRDELSPFAPKVLSFKIDPIRFVMLSVLVVRLLPKS